MPRSEVLQTRSSAPVTADMAPSSVLNSLRTPMVSVLTGGGDKPYAVGLATTLIAQDTAFEFIGSDDLDVPEIRQSPLARFLNLRGNQNPDVGRVKKMVRVLAYYARLILYAATTRARVFHILWHNKFEFFDRTILMLYYRALGKRIVFTAHNVNARKRDGGDSRLYRFSLRFQYRRCHHIFVHTERMKQELMADYSIPPNRITVIPFGINSTVPDTALTPAEARAKLGLAPGDKAMLFFGNIAPYKGVELLVEAFALLLHEDPSYRLIVVGRPKNCESYWAPIQARLASAELRPHVIARIEFVPDEETELFFKAADALVLPYRRIFQSGVLFLGYNFGLPVIATDVGSLKDDILEGETGFVCRPDDPTDLARALRYYFSSPLRADLSRTRTAIRKFAAERYSWEKVGNMTRHVYQKLLAH